MKEKFKAYCKAFKWNGTEQIKIAKLLAIFVLGNLLLFLIISPRDSQKDPIAPKARLAGSLFVSLPIRLLGSLQSSGPTRMSLKHESKDILIPEVFIHGMQWKTAHSGIAKIEIHPSDLKSIIELGEFQQFIAFPWNSQLLNQPGPLGPQPKDHYEIHLD